MLFYVFLPHLGGCCGSTKKRTIVGGWAWAWWLVTDVQRLSLEVMTLNPMCEMVETAQGVPLTVTGVAQCKIMKVFSRSADLLMCTYSTATLTRMPILMYSASPFLVVSGGTRPCSTSKVL